MQNLPDNDFFITTGPRPKVGPFTAAWEALRDFLDQHFALETIVTLSSDVLTISMTRHVVAAQTGATDNLAQISITDIPDGTLVEIGPDAGDTITVKNNSGSAGKILLSDAVDFAMSDPSMRLWLRLDATAQSWSEINRSYGSNKTAFRTWLGLVIGTTVQAYSAILAALAGLTGAADKLAYFTGATSMAVTDLTSYARTLLALSSKAAVQAELGITATPVLRDYFAGGQMTNDAVAPNTKINIAAGVKADSTNTDMIAWAAGSLDLATTGVNGLRTGSLAANTDYAVFAIKGSSGAGFFADTAMTPGTRPSGYTASWTRLFIFRTDASAHVIPTIQTGRRFRRKSLSLDINAVSVTNAGVNIATSMMAGKKWPIILQCFANNTAGSAAGIYIRDPDATDGTPTIPGAASGALAASIGFIATNGANAGGQVEVVTDTSGQVFGQMPAAFAASTLRGNLLYWDDDGLQ